MVTAAPVIDGYVPFVSRRTWYRIVGEKEQPGSCRCSVCMVGRVFRTTISNRWRAWQRLAGA